MITKATKWGNSLAVRIPKQLSDCLRIKEGTPLEFEQVDVNILIKPVQDKKKEYATSFKRAALDMDMKAMAEEGLYDYLKQLKKYN